MGQEPSFQEQTTADAEQSALVEKAFKRAIEYLVLSGETEKGDRFYANVAFHLVTEMRQHRHFNFLIITNGTIRRYLAQRNRLREMSARQTSS